MPLKLRKLYGAIRERILTIDLSICLLYDKKVQDMYGTMDYNSRCAEDAWADLGAGSARKAS